MNKLNEYIQMLCSDLNINTPRIKYVSSLPNTQLARLNLFKNVIEIKKGISSPDLYFAIAHELRHVWQCKTGVLNVDTYNYDSSSDGYNLQSEEIDANAYATIVMVEVFGIEPNFEGLSEEVKQAIHSRIDEICLCQ